MAYLGEQELRTERGLLDAASQSVEKRFYGAVERIRRANHEKRVELEATLAEAEQDLNSQQEAVHCLHAEVQYEQLHGTSEAHNGLLGTWPEVESAAAAARAADTKLMETRRRQQELAETDRHQLEEWGRLFKVYSEATGVHWDDRSDCIAGYAAVAGSARYFELTQEEADDQKATADRLWSEIAACLPEGSICSLEEEDEVLHCSTLE